MMDHLNHPISLFDYKMIKYKNDYNFDNPNEPIAVSLAAGKGKEFKNDMDAFVQDIKKDIKAKIKDDKEKQAQC